MDASIPTPPDALVVLGCRVLEGGHPSRAARRRADAAARAWHAWRPALVIASGGRRWHGVPEADVLASLLERGGVPRASIVRELCSLSTVENAAYSAELLRAASSARVGVVTCDWHMARARACFALFGVSTVPFPAEAPEQSLLGRLTRRALEAGRGLLDRRAGAHWMDT
jgi:uncharacterized SAM-binding protein YcdF (DUF218 family)